MEMRPSKAIVSYLKLSHLSELFVAMPGVLVVVRNEVELSGADAGQWAVGATQQE